MKIRLAQLDVTPGRPAANARHMLSLMETAASEHVELIVFPEMAIPGYLLGDEWERQAFLRDCEAAGNSLRAAATNIAVIFGNVGLDWDRRNEDGRTRKYNALFAAENGQFVGPADTPYAFVIKTLLPNYREFDDSRHFFDLRKLALEEQRPVQDLIQPITLAGTTIGGVLCEDAWCMDYSISPLDILAGKGCDLFVNISASPYTVNKNHKRNRVFADHAARIGSPLAYVNNVGIQNNGKTVYTFDGSSCLYDNSGGVVQCPTPFSEDALTVDLPQEGALKLEPRVVPREDTIADMAAAVTYGTRKFMEQCGVRRVVIGLSGGIDSAVAAAVYGQILAPQDLLLVNMPSRFNSQTTRDLSRALASELGCLYAEIPIEESVTHTRDQVEGLLATSIDGKHQASLDLSQLAMENIQARDRSARILAAVASAFGGVFTCNANKSELTVGYTTFYGDLAGFLANLADLWKTEVYALAQHLNEHVYGRTVIPQGSLDIVPSAELSHDQDVDAGKGDPMHYPYHDQLFKSWVEWWNRATPEDNLEAYLAGTLSETLGYAGDLKDHFATPQAFIEDLERWWNCYQGMGLAKRIQAPPIVAIKKRAFGFDHRESQMGPLCTERYLKLKAKILGR